MTVLLRKPRTGLSSCRGVSSKMRNPTSIVRNGRGGGSVAHAIRVIRWGCTGGVPHGAEIFNTARAIHEVNNKGMFRVKMDEQDLCPSTYTSERLPHGFFNPDKDFVFRPAHHTQGQYLYVARGREQCEEAIASCGEGWYASPLIAKVAEYRVLAAQGRVLAVLEKTPGNPEDVAWNVAEGGRLDNVRWDDWPLRVVRTSLEAFNLSELDFGAVDVIVDAEGRAYVLEINSAPHLSYEYTQEVMAKAFDYMIDHGKTRIPLIAERGGYKKFIHPSITERAQVCAD